MIDNDNGTGFTLSNPFMELIIQIIVNPLMLGLHSGSTFCRPDMASTWLTAGASTLLMLQEFS